MASFNEKQLICLLTTTLLNNEAQVIQVINSCSSTLLMLIDEYQKSEKALEDAVNERNLSLRRYIRRRERFILRSPRINWINPGRTDLWWDNLIKDKMPSSEWRNNLRMNKEVFLELVRLLSPILNPHPNAFRPDMLSTMKKVGMCLYYLKDQGGYRMTCNAFGIAVPTLSRVLPQFCDAVKSIAPQFLKLPKTDEETGSIMDKFEAKFGFPQVVGCIDGTHIPIKCPAEHGNEFFCYKMKHSINVQAICDEKGIFIDVDASWPGSTHDGKVFKNSLVNQKFVEKKFPGKSRILINGRESVSPLLIGDPAYPLLPTVMKEFSHCKSNDDVLFNAMLRSTRNQIECAFGRLKARWRILMRALDVDISLIPSLIYTCFILHNFCELHKMTVMEDEVMRIMNKEMIDQNCEHHSTEDPTYTYNTGEGAKVRETIKTFFSLH